jgi:hypothetical protein
MDGLFFSNFSARDCRSNVVVDSSSVLSRSVVENDPADGHGHQQQTYEKEQQPGEDPPDAGLGWENAALGLKTVSLAQYPGQQQEEPYRKH